MAHDKSTTHGHDRNEDPITGEPGAHPIGAGLGAAVGGAGGAAAGAAAGAALGGVAGPIGVAAGAVIGGLVGGLAGKGVAEQVNPTEEHEYWRNEYKNRDYVNKDRDYDSYAPAYQHGWESYQKHNANAGESGRAVRFEDVERDLGNDWETNRKQSDLSWHEASGASRDAWNRTHERYGSGSSAGGAMGSAGGAAAGLGNRAANAVDKTIGTDINNDGITSSSGGSAMGRSGSGDLHRAERSGDLDSGDIGRSTNVNRNNSL